MTGRAGPICGSFVASDGVLVCCAAELARRDPLTLTLSQRERELSQCALGEGIGPMRAGEGACASRAVAPGVKRLMGDRR